MSVRASIIAALWLASAAVASAQAPHSLDVVDAEVAEARAELERASVARDRVGAEIEALVEERAAAQRRLRDRVGALHRVRRAGLLPLAEGFEALLRHHARIERLERMVGRDARALRSLESRVAALRDEGARLAGQAERGEASLAALRQRKAMLERAALGAWVGIEPPAAWGEAWSSAPADDGGPSFGALRGRLPAPVVGAMQEASREGGGGLEIAAAAGAPVRAVAPGRVAYAAQHPAYGRLIIADHGDGHYSVYGGLGAIALGVGAPLEPGAILGTVGATPVFFQLRRGTRALDAREWLEVAPSAPAF